MSHPFSVSPQNYFKILNLDQAFDDFTTGRHEAPLFEYPHFSSSDLEDRMKRLKVGSDEKKSLELVSTAIALRDTADDGLLNEYRSKNAELYTLPNKSDVEMILARTKRKVNSLETAKLWEYIERSVGSIDPKVALYKPSKELFDHMSEYLRQYVGPEWIQGKNLREMLESTLRLTELDKKGWRLHVADDARHASVVHSLKLVVIGRDYRPRSELGRIRIVLHEVYGHALRGRVGSISENEGFAGVLEQLASSHYRTFRSYRYLAAGLGWGVMGEPMNFSQVYEILWRVMVIGEHYGQIDARWHAFRECARVFRGANPRLAGAVFLKDASYYAGNVATWRALEKINPSYGDFCEMIEGKRKVVS